MKSLSIITLVFMTTTVAGMALELQGRADPGEPCAEDTNCYGGAKCCKKICTLGGCSQGPNNAGAKCADQFGCFGGAQCCSGVCKLGSCRMDGSCDANNDCYGWCHNNVSLLI